MEAEYAMIRRALIILLVAAGWAWAEGPKFGGYDKNSAQEFENVYLDVRSANVAISSLTTSVTALQSAPTLSSTSFVTVGSGTQHILGTKSFNGQIIGKGTATNDSAAVGYIGEYVSATSGGAANCPATDAYGDLATISLTAGDWDVSGIMLFARNGSTWASVIGAISTTSGNSSAGTTFGDNLNQNSWASSSSTPGAAAIVIPAWRLSLAATTSVYLKYNCTFSAGTPFAIGRISARRMR